MHHNSHLAGNGRTLVIRLIAAAMVAVALLSLVACGGGSPPPTNIQPPSASSSSGLGSGGAVATVASAGVTNAQQVRPATGAGQTWTILLYQDADDQVLEKDIYVDLNEAERIGSTDRVNIVAQVDRFRGAYAGDGNWTGTGRFYLTQDNDLERVRSQVVQDLGEVNMSDPQTLVDFAVWGIQNYPADKYVLIMSDHGAGWPGGWNDPDLGRGRSAVPNVPVANAMGNMMYLMQMDQALQAIRDQTGINAFEIVGFDACLMGHLEVFAMLAPHARYGLASQEVEPAVGWAYTSFLGTLVQNPDMSGAELATAVVNSYINEDQRILDDVARQDFARGGYYGAPSIKDLVTQLGYDVTLTAADLSKMPALVDATNQFAYAMKDMNQKQVAQARNYAQSFTSIFGQQVPASYIDLAHFASLIQQQSNDPAIQTAIQNLYQSIDQSVVALKRGPKKPGAYGVSVYFPNSQLFGSDVAGMRSYTAVADRFSRVSLWDDFLTYHYTGRQFQPNAQELVVPPADAPVVAPGAAEFSDSDLTVSSDVAAPGRPITLSADVSGDNVGYIYLFAGFYDAASNSINVIDTDYIDSGDTREVSGVYYPEWGEGAFTLEFEWEPIVFELTDGVNSTLALLQPLEYGFSPEETVYGVDGLYTFASGEQYWGQLQMVNGYQLRVILWTEDDAVGGVREVVPQPGDQFTVLERWLDLDDEGNIIEENNEYGGTLAFGQYPITWTVVDAPIGEYTVGYVVEDLDGGKLESYANIYVE